MWALEEDDLIGRTFGKCELQALLGRGGMGAVYRAQQTSPAREVAVKILHGSQAGRSSRFAREAQTLADLEHPHVVPIYDFGIQDGISYIVMRLMRGGSLADRVHERRFSLNETKALIDALAGALDYVHSQGVIHRDLKAANVLYDRHDVAYLADFGVARLRVGIPNQTVTSRQPGTPAYMAPELWREEEPTEATDIYALGILAFRLLTGGLPFTGGTWLECAGQHLTRRPPSAHALDPAIPPAIDEVLDKALAKDPDERYPSAGAFAGALSQALREGETAGAIQAQRSGALVESSKLTGGEVISETLPAGPPVYPVEETTSPDELRPVSPPSPPSRPRRKWKNRAAPGLGFAAGLIVLLLIIGKTTEPPPPTSAPTSLAAATPPGNALIAGPLTAGSNTATQTTTPSPTPSATQTATPSVTPSPTPSATQTATPSPTPGVTLSSTPSVTQIVTPSVTRFTTATINTPIPDSAFATPVYTRMEGQLTVSEPVVRISTLWTAGEIVDLRVHSREFDALLTVLSAAGEDLTANDDCGQSHDSCLVEFVVPGSGRPVLEIRDFEDDTTGSFLLETTRYGICGAFPVAVVPSDAANGINIRAVPNPANPILMTAPRNACFSVIGRSRNGEWWQVALPDGSTGWVSRNAVHVVGDPAEVAITS